MSTIIQPVYGLFECPECLEEWAGYIPPFREDWVACPRGCSAGAFGRPVDVPRLMHELIPLDA